MYTLLPATPQIDFIPLMVTFVVATLLGFISHAPGSIGVLDAAMLVSLSGFEKEQLLASLLIFRALYFLLPFVLAILILGIRELWLATMPKGFRLALRHQAADWEITGDVSSRSPSPTEIPAPVHVITSKRPSKCSTTAVQLSTQSPQLMYRVPKSSRTAA